MSPSHSCKLHPDRRDTAPVHLCADCLIRLALAHQASPNLCGSIKLGMAALTELYAMLQGVLPDEQLQALTWLSDGSSALRPHRPGAPDGGVFGVVCAGPSGNHFYGPAVQAADDPTIALVGRNNDRIHIADIVSYHKSPEAAKRAYHRGVRAGRLRKAGRRPENPGGK